MDSHHQNTVEILTQLQDELESTKAKLFEAKTKCEYLEHIIDVLPCHVYWTDKNHILLGVNDAILKAANLNTKDEVIGKSNYDMPWRASADQYNQTNQRVMDRGETITTEESQLVDQSKTLLSIKVPLLDKQNNLMGVVGISFDISDRKKQEEELKIAKEQAEAANKAKSEFIMNISHDLRTPFSGIIGLTQFLKNQETDENKKHLLNDIETSSQQILAMINGIIDLIANDDSIEESESINLKTFIQHIDDLIRASVNDKKLHFSINLDPEIPAQIIAPKKLLHAVFLNLLSNAVKFTQEGSIELILEVIDKTHDSVTLKLIVKDTGIGIPSDKLDAIFEKFSRLNQSYQGIYQGSGLGLWFVKKAVNKLNGKINVISTVNKGSTFVVEFNCIIVEKLINLEHVKDKTNAKKITSMLLVEDNVIAQKAATLLLKEYFDCHITAAASAEKALQFVKQTPFDLILLDIGLPDMDGFEAAKKLHEAQPQTPIVGLTAHAENKLLQIQEHYFDFILIKPLTLPLCKDLHERISG